MDSSNDYLATFGLPKDLLNEVTQGILEGLVVESVNLWHRWHSERDESRPVSIRMSYKGTKVGLNLRLHKGFKVVHCKRWHYPLTKKRYPVIVKKWEIGEFLEEFRNMIIHDKVRIQIGDLRR